MRRWHDRSTIGRSMLALTFGAALQACSVSSQVSAVSVRVENGAAVTEEFDADARCGLEPGTEARCSAGSRRRRGRLP